MNALVIAVVVAVGLLLLSVFIYRVWTPLRTRRTLEKSLKSKTRHDPRALEDPKLGTVAWGVDYLRITSGNGDPSQLQWSEVEDVHAYKRDLFTTDLICLAFKKSGTEEYYEVHEEMAGYHDLLEVLQSCLPEFTLEWFCDVAFPAFETQHQIVWKRSPNNKPAHSTAGSGST